MPNNPSEAKYKSVGFFYLVCDASFGYFEAKGQKSFYSENRGARWSILSCVLSVESFSNCLLEAMSLSKTQFKKIDRLPTLDKVDEYLDVSGAEILDRNKTEVNAVKELIKARNDFVHVKTSRTQMAVGPSTLQSVDTPRYDAMLKPGKHPSLGISKDGAFWTADDARSALHSVAGFFRHVLNILDEDRATSVLSSLVPRVEIDNLGVPALFDGYTNELDRLKREGIDFTFLIE